MTDLDLQTDQTLSTSNDQTSSEPPPQADSTQPSALLPVEAVEECEKCVEEYRAGTADKVLVFLRLQTIISRYATDDQARPTIQALKSYLAMLDNHDRLREGAVERGRLSAESDSARRHTEPGEAEPGISPQGELSPQDKVEDTSKRPRSPGPDDRPDSPSSKRHIDPSRFPWVIQEEVDPAPLSLELRQTQTCLENFARDPKFAKSSLLNSARCPQFPDGEWTNIILGRVVDLDHVLSGIYAVGADDRKREKVGTLEFVVGSCTPAKTVRSHSDWTIAWDGYVEALLFVFPHRNSELIAYAKFIRQLFTSMPPERHGRVLHFDKAVRLCVSQRRDLLLTDHANFTNLSLLWLQNGGGSSGLPRNETTRSSRRPSSSSKPRREACRRFNAGTCPNSQSSCDYAHICSKCRGTGHIASACGK
ncbi:uncharacterized protein LACBIDRAFT_313122 [Laccaria bicolor S238N-H82]|uniref:Predicted protein n=1 Tax=Laccaria bicolor (strain S238N-H82 / ATCC MYA-4686) TaxID=486041 RepID=B0DXL0_LACBS|nr:uncharacterized protein LACBIDRAFT_313122 [Laccaria bicolor S238N-H82]EDR00637.1 predicted protein [Laccaria bicolor S238N-H82]|eukprot:XP_001888646.1 predicted protein [Laccaria bicolor S238N-H82]